MGKSFDETDDRVVVTDAAALSIPAADWVVGGWFKQPDNTGSITQYLFSWGTFAANPSFNITIQEASNGTSPNCMFLTKNGAVQIGGTATPGASNNVWHFVLAQRSSGTVTFYINNASDGSTTDATFIGATNVAGDAMFGSRVDLNVDRFFGGHLAEWFKLDRALDSNERLALKNGMSPSRLPGIFDSTSWYVPMFHYGEYAGRLTLTNSGSVAGDHPPVELPYARKQSLFIAPAAAPTTGARRRRVLASAR